MSSRGELETSRVLVSFFTLHGAKPGATLDAVIVPLEATHRTEV